MLSFLHDFEPQSVLFSVGSLTVYWYGLFMVLGILAALLLTLRLAKHYDIASDIVFDLSFWLIIGGLAGARIYEIFLMFPYYVANPWQAPKVWEGGLAIHGGIVAGLIIIWVFGHVKKISFWKLAALIAPGVAIGQAIGRWGNYFNQELFGRPTILPWGIPINPANRPLEFIGARFFHPTFIYESLGCLLIAALLIGLNIYAIRHHKLNRQFFLWSAAAYVISYSLLRFGLEFLRLDDTPTLFGWRWPQIASLLLIISSLIALIISKHHDHQRNSPH